MTSLEKAMLSPTQVFRHVRAVGRKYSTCDAVLITSSAWPTLTVIQASRRRSWQTGGEQLHGPDLVAAEGARDQSGHRGDTANFLGRCPDGGRVMRNHRSIHLFIVGIIAGLLDRSCSKHVGGAGQAARQSRRRLWFYRRRHRALVVCQGNQTIRKARPRRACSSAWAPDRCPCAR